MEYLHCETTSYPVSSTHHFIHFMWRSQDEIIVYIYINFPLQLDLDSVIYIENSL